MKKLLFILTVILLSISTFATNFKPLPKKPLLDITYLYIGNLFHADNSDQVQVHINIDHSVSVTVQYHMVITCWTHYYDWFSHSWKWGWRPLNFNIFIPPGSVEGSTYAELQVGEYADENNYTIDGPYTQ